MAESIKQSDLALKAESELLDAYELLQKNYQLGLSSLIQVITAHSQLAQASIARVKAELDLNQQRVSLHRSLISDQFSQIKGCQIAPAKKGKLGRLLRPSKGDKSLDQVCIEGGSRN